jgi:hypothetical protein
MPIENNWHTHTVEQIVDKWHYNRNEPGRWEFLRRRTIPVRVTAKRIQGYAGQKYDRATGRHLNPVSGSFYRHELDLSTLKPKEQNNG